MTDCEASQLLRSCRDKVYLKVMDNGASELRWCPCQKIENNSFVLFCHADTLRIH